jgi:hypothetical protein
MDDFIIQIEPGISNAPLSLKIHRLNANQWRSAALYETEYNIKYIVIGKVFEYYPSSLSTIYNDIQWEWEKIRNHESHDMTLSGYTVLKLRCVGEVAEIYNPLLRGDPALRDGTLVSVKMRDLEKKFQIARNSIWRKVVEIAGAVST